MPVADQLVLRGAAVTLSFQYFDADGEPADPGVMTIGVNRADGTVLVAPGAATSGTGSSPRTFALTAAQTSTLDLLTATWTRTADSTTHQTRAEIVGGYYFTLSEARDSDPVLADDVKFPSVALRVHRRDVEAEFEQICGLAFVPRYRRQTLNGTGTPCLLLPTPVPRRVAAVADIAVDGSSTPWTAPELAAIRVETTGVLTSSLRPFPFGRQNVVIAWEHGHDRPPAEVKDVALVRLRHRAVNRYTAIPDRATSFQVEGGSVYRLDTAGSDRTGVPEVDAVLHRYRVSGIA